MISPSPNPKPTSQGIKRNSDTMLGGGLDRAAAARTSKSPTPSAGVKDPATIAPNTKMFQVLRGILSSVVHYSEEEVCQVLRETFEKQGWQHFAKIDETQQALDVFRKEKEQAVKSLADPSNYKGLGRILLALSYTLATEHETAAAWSAAQPYLRTIARLHGIIPSERIDTTSLDVDISPVEAEFDLVRAKLRRTPNCVGLLGGDETDTKLVRAWVSDRTVAESEDATATTTNTSKPRYTYPSNLLYLLIRIAALSHPASDQSNRRIVHAPCAVKDDIFVYEPSLKSLPDICESRKNTAWEFIVGLEPGETHPTVYTYHPAENLFVFYIWQGQTQRDQVSDLDLVKSLSVPNASMAEVRHYRMYNSSHPEDVAALTIHLVNSILGSPSPLPQGMYRSHASMFGDVEPTPNQLLQLRGLHVRSLVEELDRSKRVWEAARAGTL